MHNGVENLLTSSTTLPQPGRRAATPSAKDVFRTALRDARPEAKKPDHVPREKRREVDPQDKPAEAAADVEQQDAPAMDEQVAAETPASDEPGQPAVETDDAAEHTEQPVQANTAGAAQQVAAMPVVDVTVDSAAQEDHAADAPSAVKPSVYALDAKPVDGSEPAAKPQAAATTNQQNAGEPQAPQSAETQGKTILPSQAQTADDSQQQANDDTGTRPKVAVQLKQPAEAAAATGEIELPQDEQADVLPQARVVTTAAERAVEVTELMPKQTTTAPAAKPQAVAVAPQASAEVEFAGTNHERIVTAVRTQLLPHGGTMHLRLDPPELGEVQITVRMVDGVVSAAFETASDQAAKLLSHSLGQLKQGLESQGMSVEKLHVQQSPRDERGGNGGDDGQQRQSQEDASAQQREQQRRELLRRMWQRLGVGDPLDLVA